MTEPLRVDTERLAAAAARMLANAEGIPNLPASPALTGSDPLTQAIAAQAGKIDAQIAERLAAVQKNAAQLSENTATAARMYDESDREIADGVNRHTFGDKGTVKEVGSGSGSSDGLSPPKPGEVRNLGPVAAQDNRDGHQRKNTASRPVDSPTNTGGSSGGVKSAPYRGGGHVFAADNGGKGGGAKGGESGETDEKGYGGSVSKGKGGTTPIHPHGDEEHHWGHPTDPHEWHPSGEPNYPHSGTFDDGHGTWEWKGPGRQGGAEGTQTHEGIGGNSKIHGWIAEGDTKWSGNVFGHQLDLTADGEFGAHAGADGAATQQGVSDQLDAFAGIEAGVGGTYHLGPVDLSLGGGGQMGYGGNAGFDFGMADDGKFVMGGSLGAAWGLGGKISPKIAVDPKAVEGWVDKAGEWLGGLFK